MARTPDAGPWTITIPRPVRWLTANDRGHWDITTRTKAWRNAAFVAALRVKPPKGLNLVRVDALFQFAGQPPVRELENLRPTLKAAVDGAIGPRRRTAAGYGIVPDDSDRHVLYGYYAHETTGHTRVHPPSQCCCGALVLTVSEVRHDP
jgi:hypothetical protein